MIFADMSVTIPEMSLTNIIYAVVFAAATAGLALLAKWLRHAPRPSLPEVPGWAAAVVLGFVGAGFALGDMPGPKSDPNDTVVATYHAADGEVKLVSRPRLLPPWADGMVLAGGIGLIIVGSVVGIRRGFEWADTPAPEDPPAGDAGDEEFFTEEEIVRIAQQLQQLMVGANAPLIAKTDELAAALKKHGESVKNLIDLVGKFAAVRGPDATIGWQSPVYDLHNPFGGSHIVVKESPRWGGGGTLPPEPEKKT